MSLAGKISGSLAGRGSGLAGGSGGEETIADILGVLYHSEFRADDPGLVLVGDHVATLPNMAGNGDLTQGTDSKRLIYNATSFNGRPGLTGDGSTQFMHGIITGIPAVNRPYVWLRAKEDILQAGARFWFELSDFGSASNTVQLIPYDNFGSSWILHRNGDVATFGTPDTNRHTIEAGYTVGGTAAAVLDGTPTDTFHAGAAGAILDNLTLFALYSAGTGCLSATFAHMVIALNEPTVDQRSAVRAKLLELWP